VKMVGSRSSEIMHDEKANKNAKEVHSLFLALVTKVKSVV